VSAISSSGVLQLPSTISAAFGLAFQRIWLQSGAVASTWYAVSGAVGAASNAVAAVATSAYASVAVAASGAAVTVSAAWSTATARVAFAFAVMRANAQITAGAIVKPFAYAAGAVVAAWEVASAKVAAGYARVAATSAVQSVAKATQVIRREIGTAVASVSPIVTSAFGKAFGGVSAAATAMNKAVSHAFVAIKVAAVATTVPIGTAFASMFTGIRIAAGGAATAVRGIGMAAAQVAAGVFGLASIVAAPLVLIGGAIAGVMLASEKGVSALKAGWASVSANFEHIAIQIQKTFTAAFDLVVRIGVKALNALGIQFDTSGTDILDNFNEKMQGLGDWIEDALVDVQFFFENFETYFDLGLAYVDKWAAGVTARISELFTKDLPPAIAKGMIQIADTFGGNSLFEKFIGADAASMKQGAELILQAQAIGRGFTGGMRLKSDAERAAQDRIDEISKGLGGDLEAFRWQQKIDTEFKAAMSSIDDAIKNVIPTAGDMAAASDVANANPDSASGISTGVQAMNERQGPGVALRGSQDAFDVINRAIRGSKQDQQHKETIGVLNQIAAKEPVVLEVAEI